MNTHESIPCVAGIPYLFPLFRLFYVLTVSRHAVFPEWLSHTSGRPLLSKIETQINCVQSSFCSRKGDKVLFASFNHTH